MNPPNPRSLHAILITAGALGRSGITASCYGIGPARIARPGPPPAAATATPAACRRRAARCSRGATTMRSRESARRRRRRSPGFFASSAAAIRRTRSITRLRFGAPAAANVRLRCSRVTPIAVASASCAACRPACATMQRHAACCSGCVMPSDGGGSCSASKKRVENVAGRTRSRERVVVDAIDEHVGELERRALRDGGASVPRSGVMPKNGKLGNSRASSAARHVSSARRRRRRARRRRASCETPPRTPSRVRPRMSRARRRGNAARAAVRTRSRVAKTTMHGGAAATGTRTGTARQLARRCVT